MSTSEQVQAFLFLYGPSCAGLLVSVLSCIRARKIHWVFIGYVLAVLLHLVSVLFLTVLTGMGEAWSGQGEAHDYPQKFFVIGCAVLMAPLAVRLICEAIRSRKKMGQT